MDGVLVCVPLSVDLGAAVAATDASYAEILLRGNAGAETGVNIDSSALAQATSIAGNKIEIAPVVVVEPLTYFPLPTE